jgi:hypothetical protein
MISIDLETLVLGIGSILGLIVLLQWQRRPDSFDLRHLLVDSKTDRASLMKIGQLFALLVSTWVLIHETRAGKLSEWLYGSYMLTWAGANLVSRFTEKKSEAPK